MIKALLTCSFFLQFIFCSAQYSSEHEKELVAQIDQLVAANNCDLAKPLLEEWNQMLDPDQSKDFLKFYLLQKIYADCYYKDGEFEKSDTQFEKVVEYAFDKPKLHRKVLSDIHKVVAAKFRKENYKDSEKILSIGVEIAEKLDSTEYLILAHSGLIANYAISLSNNRNKVVEDKLVYHYKQKLYYLDKTGNVDETYSTLFNLSRSLLHFEQYKEAANYLEKAELLRPSTQYNTIKDEVELNELSAHIYKALGNEQTAKNLYKNILSSKDTVHFEQKFQAQYSLSYMEFENKNYEKVLVETDELLTIAATKKYVVGEALTLQLLAKTQLKLNELQLAKKNIQKARNLLSELKGNNSKLCYILRDYCDIAFAIGKKDYNYEANVLAALKRFKVDNDLKNISYLYFDLSRYYKEIGDKNAESLYTQLLIEVKNKMSSGQKTLEESVATKLLEIQKLVEAGSFLEAKYHLDTLARYEDLIDEKMKPVFIENATIWNATIIKNLDGSNKAIDFLVEKMMQSDDAEFISNFLLVSSAWINNYPTPQLIVNCINRYKKVSNQENLPYEIEVLLMLLGIDDGKPITLVDTINDHPYEDNKLEEYLSTTVEIVNVFARISNAIDSSDMDLTSLDFNDSIIQLKFKNELQEAHKLNEDLLSMVEFPDQNASLLTRLEMMDANTNYLHFPKLLANAANNQEELLNLIELTRNVLSKNDRLTIQQIQKQLNEGELLLVIDASNSFADFTALAISKENNSLYTESFKFLNGLFNGQKIENVTTPNNTAQRGVQPTETNVGKEKGVFTIGNPLGSSFIDENAVAFSSKLNEVKKLVSKVNLSSDEDWKLFKYKTALYQTIFSFPLAHHQNIDKILICANGELSQFPFEAIEDDLGRFVVELFEISYIPNISYLFKESIKNERSNNVVIGLSDFSNIISGQTESCIPANFNDRSIRKMVAEKIDDNESLNCLFNTNGLNNLEGAIVESKTASELLATDKVYLEEAATEQNVKQLFSSEEEYNIIHFASHGLFNANVPELSAILLNPSKKEDGFLSLLEIEKAKINANLVVMSSCESNLGKVYEGGGVLGLPQAFINAGAKNVIASLWKVDDEATRIFMTEFYNHIKAEESYSKALRATKLKFLNGDLGEQYKDHYYWAGFVYTGR